MKNLAASQYSVVSESNYSVRLATVVRLRWIAVAGQLATVGYVFLILGFSLPVAYCLGSIALSAWVNVILTILMPSRTRLGAPTTSGLLVYDVLQLMTLLWLTGGIENPFAMLLMVPVIVSSATMPLRNTLGIALLVTAVVTFLIYNYTPLPWFPGFRFQLPFIYKMGLAAAIAVSMVFLSLYAWRLAEEARQMSAALAATELVLSREQKLHALDGLAAAAAHELGTPLSTISLVTKELESEYADNKDLQEDMRLLRSQADRCREILQKLTRAPDAQEDPVHGLLSVSELIEEASVPYRDRGIIVSVTARPLEKPATEKSANPTSTTTPAAIPPLTPAEREPVGERQPGMIFGLGNLIENAVGYAQTRVDVSARWDQRKVTVEIADDGPGFPVDLMDQLGDPYVTTRGSGKPQAKSKAGGLGLGFFIAKTLLERSGADVEFTNREAPERGAIVRAAWSRDIFDKPPEGFSPHGGRH
ncbi:MAG: ActS/PrrB/RegB family redox-sensitive histidine kinase [Pseudomonadota bacterium]